MMDFSLRTSSKVIKNVEHDPFMLSICLDHYGIFKKTELEVRITNDYIEISGEQSWQMANGGADKRSFVRRHVLPNHIDLNSIFCRLVETDEKKLTILVSAHNVSFVTKITNGNRPTVDYTLAFNEKGIQYLKRYNNKSSNSSLNQAIMIRDRIRTQTHTSNNSSKVNSPEQPAVTTFHATKNNADALFGMIRKASPSSRLFTNEQVQKNISLANELKNKEKAKYKKIHLTVDQLMAQPIQPINDETPKKKKKSRKSKSKKNKNKADESKESIQSVDNEGDKTEANVDKKEDVKKDAAKKDESKKEDDKKEDSKKESAKKGTPKRSARKDKSKQKDKQLKEDDKTEKDDKSKNADKKKDESTGHSTKTAKVIRAEEAKKLEGASSDSSLDTFTSLQSDVSFELQTKNENKEVSKDKTTLRTLFSMFSGSFSGVSAEPVVSASTSTADKAESQDKLSSKKDSNLAKSDDNNNSDKSKKEKRVVIVG